LPFAFMASYTTRLSAQPRRDPKPDEPEPTGVTYSWPGGLLSAPFAALSPGGLTADECDRDVPHCRIGLGAMPMPLAGLDLHDVTNSDSRCSCSAPTIPVPEVTISN
jgi:hypothetical protein